MKTHTAQLASEIRAALKKEFPNVTFSVVKEHHGKIAVAAIKAPIQLVDDGKKYECVNEYYIDRIECKTKRTFWKQVWNIIQKVAGITYHETGDYGTQPSLYIDLSAGKWDKQFQFIA